MTENTDPNGHMTDEDLEIIKGLTTKDLHYAEDRPWGYPPPPEWWIAEPYYDDVD